MLDLAVLCAHLTLVAAILWLFYAVADLYRQDRRLAGRGVKGRHTPSMHDQVPRRFIPPEARTQAHLFWTAQLLDMRLRGFDRSMLSHPNLNREVREYLRGVLSAVAQRHQLAEQAAREFTALCLNRYLNPDLQQGRPKTSGVETWRLQSLQLAALGAPRDAQNSSGRRDNAANDLLHQLDMDDAKAEPGGIASFEMGRQAGSSWLESGKFHTDLGLVKAIEAWGFIR